MTSELHPYLKRNNGFELIGGNLWIKQMNPTHYLVVIVNRFDDRFQKGWVDFFDIDLTEVNPSKITQAWKYEEIDYDESLVSKEQITTELLAKGDYVDTDEHSPFNNEEQLVLIMNQYGIIDDLTC